MRTTLLAALLLAASGCGGGSPLSGDLEATGLLDKTLVIVTADHGEVMYSHHACNSEKLEMRCEYNHGLTLYDEDEVRDVLSDAGFDDVRTRTRYGDDATFSTPPHGMLVVEARRR